MTDDVIETAINWDHDTGEIYLCTRRKSVANKLSKMGFKAIRSEVHGYTTFKVQDTELKISLRKPMKQSAAQKKARAKTLAAARKASRATT